MTPSPPRTRAPGERVFVGLMLLLSAFLLWTAVGISGFESYTSAGAFPMAAASTMLVCSLVVAARVAGAAEAPRQEGESLARAFFRRIAPPVVLWTSAAIAAYMWLLNALGFLVASYLFLMVTMRLLGSVGVGRNAVVGAVALAGVYGIFQTAFAVALPTGTLWQGLWR